MSLFVDVIDVLSDKIKTHFIKVIEHEKNGQERSVRKVCEVCFKYMDYGELRYDKVENGISILGKMTPAGNGFHTLLLAILNESLDEDLTAVKHLKEFSGSLLAEPFRTELGDFITIGSFVTLGEYDVLENAGMLLIEKYTNETNIAETLTNLYFKAETIEYLTVFHRLLSRAKELYPDSISLEIANGYINIMGKNFERALECFLTAKKMLEQDKESKFYNLNLASVWDNIAGCYLNLGNAAATIESCDIALSYDKNAEDYSIGNSILYKKAEAFLLMKENDQALSIVNALLEENEDDEKALSIRGTIMQS